MYDCRYNITEGTDARDLAEFLSDNFHAYWSNYSIYFASVQVDVLTPKASATPIGLNWFRLETSSGIK